MRKPYEPWKSDRRNGLLAFTCSALTTSLSIAGVIYVWSGVAISVLLILYGLACRNRAARRSFGKKFEDIQSAKADLVLRKHGFSVELGRMVKPIGDIDMIASLGKRKATVEIKSFVFWKRAFLFFNGTRESRAVKQAVRQRDAIGADVAIIWLPQGRRSFIDRLFGDKTLGHGVRLVRGNAYTLSRALFDLL
jgi:hypothetical protein